MQVDRHGTRREQASQLQTAALAWFLEARDDQQIDVTVRSSSPLGRLAKHIDRFRINALDDQIDDGSRCSLGPHATVKPSTR